MKKRETKYAKKANQMIDKVIGKSNRKKVNKAVGSLIGEGSPSAKVMKKTAKKKPVQKKMLGGALFGGGGGKAIADVAGKMPKTSVVGALMDDPESFKYLGLGGAALSKLLKERGGEMKAAESKGAAGAKQAGSSGLAKPAGMSQAAQMKKKGGIIKKKIDGLATKGKTRGRVC